MSDMRYVYGRHPVGELLKARAAEVQRVLVAQGAERTGELQRLAKEHGVPLERVDKRLLGKLTAGANHQGVVAAVKSFAYVELETLLEVARSRGQAPLLLALDQIQDPHNLGSLVRSAYALGAHGLFLPKDNSCEVTGTVVKTSAGATAHLGIAQVTNLRRALDSLKEAGLWVVGTTADAPGSLEEVDFTVPTVLVVGSEGRGMRRLVAESCDILARVPMTGSLGSLNASVAGAIGLYEAVRQRRAKGS